MIKAPGRYEYNPYIHPPLQIAYQHQRNTLSPYYRTMLTWPPKDFEKTNSIYYAPDLHAYYIRRYERLTPGSTTATGILIHEYTLNIPRRDFMTERLPIDQLNLRDTLALIHATINPNEPAIVHRYYTTEEIQTLFRLIKPRIIEHKSHL